MSRITLRPGLALALTLSIVAPALAACSQGDPLTVVPEDHQATNAAIAEARKTLPIFWSKYAAQAPGFEEFRIKVGLPTPNGGVEHIWVDVDRRTDSEIVGRLANNPVNLPGRELGDEVRVDPGAISDWAYIKGERMYGAYTQRALLDHAPPEQRAELEALLSPTPLEGETD